MHNFRMMVLKEKCAVLPTFLLLSLALVLALSCGVLQTFGWGQQ